MLFNIVRKKLVWTCLKTNIYIYIVSEKFTSLGCRHRGFVGMSRTLTNPVASMLPPPQLNLKLVGEHQGLVKINEFNNNFLNVMILLG